jgi:multicomponent Na+:H+ antiporter subunit G
MEVYHPIVHYLILVLIASGTFFTFIAGFGVLRMPDIYTRMHASTKAASLGAGLMLIAAAFYFQEVGVVTRIALTTVFIFLTAPVAAHMLGRAAYLMKVKQWDGSVIDEAKDVLTLDDIPDDPKAEKDLEETDSR